ncbi:MAG: hypothetical protein E7428_00685 [Ruminococcaceae bacterium]|nr:hypothetical protein [Oscillospiraceae bacterium]
MGNMATKKISIFCMIFFILSLIGSPVEATTYGARAYNSNSSSSVNCAGYAFGYNAWYGFDIYTNSNIATWNACDSPSELMSAVKQQINAYIEARATLNNILSKKSSYSYTVVTSSQYKTVFKLAYHDTDGTNGISINADGTGDKFDFHWRFLASDGKWCEKVGYSSSRICPNNGGTNANGISPFTLIWYMGTSSSGYQYNYQGYHYLRRDW